MTPDTEPTIRPVDVQDDGDGHDLEDAMDAHQARDDLPSSSSALSSGLFGSFRDERFVRPVSQERGEMVDEKSEEDLPVPIVINSNVIKETKQGNNDSCAAYPAVDHMMQKDCPRALHSPLFESPPTVPTEERNPTIFVSFPRSHSRPIDTETSDSDPDSDPGRLTFEEKAGTSICPPRRSASPQVPPSPSPSTPTVGPGWKGWRYPTGGNVPRGGGWGFLGFGGRIYSENVIRSEPTRADRTG